MTEESYEMMRSHSATSTLTEQHEEEFMDREEEAHLLNKEHSDLEHEDERDEDEEWGDPMEEDETETVEADNPILRYVFIGIGIGLFFIIFKIIMSSLAHDSHHKERGAEKLYHNGTDYFGSTVILISLDGFRPDYLRRNLTPHLQGLADDGVMAKYMHPVFPPSTFPNHWTLVTGLYPEDHGIVANLFYDPDMNAVFSHSNRTITSDHRWWKGQPIWLTSKMHRQKSGSIMWPGSDTNYNPPDYLIQYNGSMTMKEKMDITIGWLDLPYNDRPQMMTVYVPEIDRLGHKEGPFGSHMNDYIKTVDDSIGYLVEELKRRSIYSHVHLVVVSDHGMAQVEDTRLIYYDDILSQDVLQHIRNREALPLLDLRPNSEAPQDTVQTIYNQLSNYTQSIADPHFQVYMKKDVPERYHYTHSDRITPVVAIPDVGYSFVTHAEVDKNMGFKKGGNHGYDNLADDMRAVFIAAGPKVSKVYREGTVLAPFFNVEVYQFMTELLNMDAAPNNGSLKANFPIVYQPSF